MRLLALVAALPAACWAHLSPVWEYQPFGPSFRYAAVDADCWGGDIGRVAGTLAGCKVGVCKCVQMLAAHKTPMQQKTQRRRDGAIHTTRTSHMHEHRIHA